MFVHVPSEIAAHEVEEIGMSIESKGLLSYYFMHKLLDFFPLWVGRYQLDYVLLVLINLLRSVGVEHLLRDVKDTTISTLATEVCLIRSSISLFTFLVAHDMCIYWSVESKLLDFLILRRANTRCLFFMSCTGYWETHCFEGIGCKAPRDPELS